MHLNTERSEVKEEINLDNNNNNRTAAARQAKE